MSDIPAHDPAADISPVPHRRRPRYRGKHPRRFEEKYKERDPGHHADTVAKVISSGKTPAGMHRPIMVTEILHALVPKPGDVAVDCTLGYGGHTSEILPLLQPGGLLIGIDVDPIELPKTECRLRALGWGPATFIARRSNFAGLPQVLSAAGQPGADVIVADLGVSSMQIDDPMRGFTVKRGGPLDMRMNPQRGQSASAFLEKIRPEVLAAVLVENADEPHSETLAPILAGSKLSTTAALVSAIRSALPRLRQEECELSIRRVFQAIRIAVNDEFSALDMFLRNLPGCLKPGGRIAVLTFHSGEDRRVKKALEAGLKGCLYSEISTDVIRPTLSERKANPRSSAAKLRWARRTG